MRISDWSSDVCSSDLNAERRGGIQPGITLQANGGVRADGAVGAKVSFGARIDVPPNAGSVVAAQWDFEGAGTYQHSAEITPQTRVSLTATRSEERRAGQDGLR